MSWQGKLMRDISGRQGKERRFLNKQPRRLEHPVAKCMLLQYLL